MKLLYFDQLSPEQREQALLIWDIGNPLDFAYSIDDEGQVQTRKPSPNNPAIARLARYMDRAVSANSRSEKSLWESARWCARVVGKYERGATLDLATLMGRSADTIERRAHGHWIFAELCQQKRYRKATRLAREMTHVNLSHFIELYNIKRLYDVELKEIFDLLKVS